MRFLDAVRNNSVDETFDKKALLAIGVSVALVLFVLLWTLTSVTSFLEHKSLQRDVKSSMTTTTLDTTGGFGITTTTVSAAQIQNPEAKVLNAAQLAARNSQLNSGLDPGTYGKVLDFSKGFARAVLTGDNAAQYYDPRYYPVNSTVPWIKDYAYVYAWAKKTDDPRVFKAYVVCSGTQISDGAAVQQLRYGFLVHWDNGKFYGDTSLQTNDPSLGATTIF